MAEIDDNIKEAEEEETMYYIECLEKELEEAKKTIEIQKALIENLRGYLRKFGYTDE